MSKINLKDKVHELRDLINSSICYKQSAWDSKENDDWSKLWTAVDNLEDTQSAIGEYSLLEKFSRLSIYGLLQSMYVQQDAVTCLDEAIKIQVPNWKANYPDLYKIRCIRNETIGHPVSDKRQTYVSISHTSNVNILEYGVWSGNGFQHKTINLKDIIITQHELLNKELEKIMVKINKDETQHKKQFKGKSLQKLLVSSSYHTQKLWSFERSRELAKINFEELKSIYENFKEEVKRRFKIDKVDEQGVQVPGLILVIQHLEKIVPRIEKMILMDSTVDQFDLDVYIESLDKAFNDLRKMAKEIDDDFSAQ